MPYIRLCEAIFGFCGLPVFMQKDNCILSIKHVIVIIIYFAAWMISAACMNNFQQSSLITHIFTRWSFIPVSTLSLQDVKHLDNLVHDKSYAVVANQQGYLFFAVANYFVGNQPSRLQPNLALCVGDRGWMAVSGAAGEGRAGSEFLSKHSARGFVFIAPLLLLISLRRVLMLRGRGLGLATGRSWSCRP